MLTKALTDGNRGSDRSAASVRHYVPGGCENGGGIGRLVGYISKAAKEAGTDTFRHRHQRASMVRGDVICAPAGRHPDDGEGSDRCPARIHHIHVAGRGSTSRKLILTKAARFLGCFTYCTCTTTTMQATLLHARHVNNGSFAGCFNMLIASWRWASAIAMTLTTLLGVDERRIVVAHDCVPDPGAHNVRVGEHTVDRIPRSVE